MPTSFFTAFTLLSLVIISSSHTNDVCQTQQLPSGKISELSINNPTFGNTTRNYHVYVPPVYTNTKKVPLLLIYHGLNGNCGSFLRNTHFMPFADRDNFIIVSVCGTLGREGIGFNAGRCCGFPKDSTTNDIAFASWIAKNVSSLMCINEEEIFITGFSNGAFMTEVVACNASEIFRAGASISGVVEIRPGNEKGLEICDLEYNSTKDYTSLLNVHGTLDPMVPFPGDPVLGFPPVKEDLQRWYARNGCVGNFTVTFNNSKYSNELWSDCEDGTQVELVIHYGGTHEWPEDEYFNTTAYIIEFFYRNGMNSNTSRKLFRV